MHNFHVGYCTVCVNSTPQFVADGYEVCLDCGTYLPVCSVVTQMHRGELSRLNYLYMKDLESRGIAYEPSDALQSADSPN